MAAVTLGSVALAPLLPGWGNGMLCLLLGMAWGNLWPYPWQKKENAAVLRWNEKNMLAWATILLGFELKTGFLAGIPLEYLPALLLSVLGAVAMGEWMVRKKAGHGGAAQARLLGAGNAICGNSAIAAVQPLIGASPAQIAVSVTLINALGLLGTLFLGPGAALMGLGPTEQAVLMEELGDADVMILRNHGTLAVGPSVAECFLRLYFIERACDAQVKMLSAGRDGLNTPPQGTPQKVESQSSGPGMGLMARGLAWPALLRKLDRIDNSYRD